MTLTRLAWPTIHLSSGHFLGRQRADSYHIQGRQQAHTQPGHRGVVTPGATEVQGLGWKARDCEAARSSPSVLRSALRCPHPSCNLECRALPSPLSRDPRAPLLQPGVRRDLRLLPHLRSEAGFREELGWRASGGQGPGREAAPAFLRCSLLCHCHLSSRRWSASEQWKQEAQKWI